MRSIFVLFALTAFSASASAAPAAGQPAQNAPAAANQAAGALPNKGKVLSTIDTGMYTYIELSRGKEKVWIAVTAMPVKKGDTVAYADGAVMTNFYSKTLNRTFPQVIFVSKASVVK